MACFHPLQAYQCSDGSIIFSERKGDVVRSLSLPCGQCRGCRLERSRQWAVRCMHEASLHEQNCFITLTYDNDHCPSDRSLNYGDFQRFMKRFRKRFKDSTIRFYMAGEYGEKFERPHFHACIFGYDFSDRVLWSVRNGVSLYTSAKLSSLWSCPKTRKSFGFSSVGDVTFESAAYIARYVGKKIQRIESLDGRKPEYSKCSLKRPIGKDWFFAFPDSVFPDDAVTLQSGAKCKPPRYYDKNYAFDYPIEFDLIKSAREVSFFSKPEAISDARLALIEEHSILRSTKLIRRYDNDQEDFRHPRR